MRNEKGLVLLEVIAAIAILFIAIGATVGVESLAISSIADKRDARLALSIQGRVQQDLTMLIRGHPDLAVGGTFERVFNSQGDELPTTASASEVAYRASWTTTQVDASIDATGNPISVLRVDLTVTWKDKKGQRNARTTITRL